jgi:hypothetical protein
MHAESISIVTLDGVNKPLWACDSDALVQQQQQ